MRPLTEKELNHLKWMNDAKADIICILLSEFVVFDLIMLLLFNFPAWVETLLIAIGSGSAIMAIIRQQLISFGKVKSRRSRFPYWIIGLQGTGLILFLAFKSHSVMTHAIAVILIAIQLTATNIVFHKIKIAK